MEAVGNIILSLHRNLQEIQSSLASGMTENRGRELLQSTIDRAEAALRAQAHALVTAARVAPRAPHLGNQSNSLAASLSTEYIPPRKRSSSGPPPPRPVRPIAPPATGRAASTGQRRPVRQPTGGHQRSGKTTNRKRLLPKMNRLDPLADPPALTESDLETGLLDLAMRGFIPQTADLTPAMERGMPCLMQQPAAFYDQGMKQLPRLDEAEHLAQVKLDLRAHILRTLAPPEEIPAQSDSFKAHPRLPPLPGRPPNAMPASAMPALPSGPGAGSVAEAYGTFCTELLEAVDVADLSAEVPALPPPPTQAEIEAAAVTRISASWRGCCQRRRYAEHLRKHNAAVRIQSGWHTCCIRSATRKELLRKEEEERKVQTMMMYQLGQDWFQAKALRRVEVHVCSLSIAEHRRRHMDSYQVLQASQIARIFRLADSKRDIIFVAPKHIHEDVLDYYSKIMQFRGIQNPPGRFQVVVPENMDMKDKFSLTQALLCSPKALKRIGRLVRNRMAMLIPEVVTHLEAKLSNTLRLPLIGPSARNMSLLSSKCNGKKLAQMAQLPIGPWAVDIYDEDEFYNSLAGLVVKHPEVRTWLFKIDDERSSRGTAYIDLLKMQQVSHSAHASAPALLGGGVEDFTEPAVIGADAGEVRAMLQHYVPRRVTLCNRQVYGDFASWLAEACRIGCVIQAVPEHLISQTSVHFQVAPDGAVDVLGTSETVTSTPFVRAASWYPHTRGSYQVLQEVGLRLGRSLAAKGLVGFASADVVFFDNPNFDVTEQSLQEHRDSPAIIGSDTPVNPEDLMFADLRSPSPDMSVATGEMPGPVELPQSRQADYEAALCHQEYRERPMDPVSLILGPHRHQGHQVGASSSSPFACWLVDIDVRLTDEAAMLFPLKFIGQVKAEPSQGLMHLTPEAAQSRELDTLYDLTEEERSSRLQRWAMITHVAAAPQLERMSHQVLFQAAKMRGVSFDLFHNTGCIFTFLDVVHNLFSLMAVEKSPEACARKMSAALAAIAEGPKGVVGAKAPRPPKVGAGEATDLLTLADVQMALRICARRFTEQKQ